MPDWQRYVRERLDVAGLPPARARRLIREIAAQLEDYHRDALARGLDETRAAAQAREQIDDWPRLARDLRAAAPRHGPALTSRFADAVHDRVLIRPGVPRMFADLFRDTRYAVRQLLGAPGFTAIAVTTLALGIGATTAIFSVVNGVLLRPLPYADPQALVRVHEILPQYGRFAVAPANFFDWRRQATVFSRVGAYTTGSGTLVGPDGPERVANAAVSWDVLDLLGVAPVLGRTFREDEDVPGRGNVIVLSHGTWQRRFGSDPSVLGRAVSVNGTPMTVIGVMPAGFYFPSRDAEFWQPLPLNPVNATRGGHFIGVLARMKPGVTVAQAGAEMRAIAERLAAEYPQNSAGETAEVVALHDNLVAGVRPALWTLMGAVAVVVLIACANVASLLLVRASARTQEIAIRAALGAGTGRIARQMLVESLLLALTGGLFGIGLAYAAITPIQTLSAGSIPRAGDIAIDPLVLAFAAVVSMGTGLLFGCAPAWQASRTALGSTLKESGRTSAGRSSRRMHNVLLVGEVAMSIVLLVAATLLLRSFDRLTRVDPGFRPAGVLTFRLALPKASYPDEGHTFSFYDRLIEKLEQVPHVTAAGLVQAMPLRGSYSLAFSIAGRPPNAPGHDPDANYRVISPDYFKTLGVPVVRGRTFSTHDSETAAPVAVVDEAFAKRYFPNEDAIGHSIRIGNGTNRDAEIVGIVGNVHYAALDATADPTMYVPIRQDIFSSVTILARTDGEAANLSPDVRRIVRELDATLPVFGLAPMSEVVSDSVAQQRFSMLLVAVFAFTALFLAAVGLYGVVAYSVRQRTREIGVRVAMGARRSQVLALIVGGGMRLVAIGLVLGLGAALAASRLLTSLLFEMTPFDVVSYLATAAVLLIIGALACYVPARRATRVDPISALRD